jgi:DNA-binding response OmpR family regulator
MAHRVLIVEDDPTLRLVIQDNLGSEGYHVDVAADGTRAVRQMQAAAPDLIVLDLTLPDFDGFDLLPMLRQRGQVPIIILTARSQPGATLHHKGGVKWG